MRKVLISVLILVIFASCSLAETIKLPEPPLYDAFTKGWNAVVRGLLDSEKLSKLMKLNDNQQIKLIQTIGSR